MDHADVQVSFSLQGTIEFSRLSGVAIVIGLRRDGLLLVFILTMSLTRTSDETGVGGARPDVGQGFRKL